MLVSTGWVAIDTIKLFGHRHSRSGKVRLVEAVVLAPDAAGNVDWAETPEKDAMAVTLWSKVCAGNEILDELPS